jgi:two-component system sensor histidine kinase KdpD
MLNARVVLLRPDGDHLSPGAGYPHAFQLDDQDMAAARWVWDNNRPAGRGSDTLPGAKWLFLPLRTERRPVGVLGVQREGTGPPFTPDEQHLLDALADLAAVAIERMQLVDEVEQAKILSETERLRSRCSPRSRTISGHRSPPSSAPSRASGATARNTTSRKEELMATIQEEAELNRFVGNLLDMTRLEAGACSPRSTAWS